ncbi:MAG: glycosyltransferase family 9 protein [Deltaproteobacteria bacterium]|nr:glycosyltransferase family 9 protein [Deltaproteobacteria bacterium]
MSTVVLEPLKLGDLIQSTPLLARLRRRSRELTLVVARPEVAAAARHCALADEVVLVDGTEAPEKIKNTLNLHPETLVNLSSSRWSTGLASQFKPKRHLGPRASPGGVVYPPDFKMAAAVMRVDRRLGMLNLVDLWRRLAPDPRDSLTDGGPPAEHPRPGGGPPALPSGPPFRPGRGLVWPVSAEALAEAEELVGSFDFRAGGPLVGFQLGCGSRLRRWPAERFVELALALGPVRIVLFGVASERALGRRFLDLYRRASPVGPEPLDLTGRTTIESLGGFLSLLNLLVSADTGVMHMAAAVGTPVLAVFGGPALAGETGPYAPGAIVAQGSAPCSPCPESGDCRKKVCPGLPAASRVVRAAGKIIGLDPPPAPSSPGGPPVVIFRATADDFGQSLAPDEPAVLTNTRKLALAVREACVGCLDKDHPPGPPEGDLACFTAREKEGPDDAARAAVEAVARLALETAAERRRFGLLAMDALAKIEGLVPEKSGG